MYSIETAGSSEEALEKVGDLEFDLLITDHRLPKMDGLQLAKSVHEHSPTTWSIVVTAVGTDDDRDEAFKKGCIAYVERPFDPDQLLGWVDQALNRSREIAGLNRPLYSSGKKYPTGIFSIDDSWLAQAVEAIEPTDKPWFTPRNSDKENEASSFFEGVSAMISQSTAALASLFRK